MVARSSSTRTRKDYFGSSTITPSAQGSTQAGAIKLGNPTINQSTSARSAAMLITERSTALEIEYRKVVTPYRAEAWESALRDCNLLHRYPIDIIPQTGGGLRSTPEPSRGTPGGGPEKSGEQLRLLPDAVWPCFGPDTAKTALVICWIRHPGVSYMGSIIDYINIPLTGPGQLADPGGNRRHPVKKICKNHLISDLAICVVHLGT